MCVSFLPRKIPTEQYTGNNIIHSLHLVHCLLQHPLVHLHLAGSHLHEAPSQPLQMHGQHPASPPLHVSPQAQSGPQLQETNA